MKPQDLRIGNKIYQKKLEFNSVNWHQIIIDVGSIDIYSLENANEIVKNNFEPIPLTEEWLLKFGFELRGNEAKFWTLQNVDIWAMGGYFFNDLDLRISSVHQLQNLFHSLTGNELTIKEESMSYDENRISNQIEAGLIQQRMEDNISAQVILEPTCMLRINMCAQQRLEQMWVDKRSGQQYWKPIPLVYPNSTIKEEN